MLQVIPKMLPDNLERILNSLPEPSYAAVSVYGLDYSSILSQIENIDKDIKLNYPLEQPFFFTWRNPPKEKILDIYRQEYQFENRLKENPPFEQSLDLSKGKRLGLEKVQWYLENGGVGIELTPWEIKIKYSGKEPAYVSQLRKNLAVTNVKMRIEVN